MSDKYSVLYKYSENLYAEGYLLLVNKAMLLREKRTGRIYVNFTFTNISEKTVNELLISVKVKGAQKMSYSYSQLWATRDMTFGEQIYIPIDITDSDNFEFEINEAIYTDNTSFGIPCVPSVCIKDAPTLSAYFNDAELEKQYRIQFGAECEYFPEEQSDLWICTCGALNHQSEAKCHLCNRSYAAMSSCRGEKLAELTQARMKRENAEKLKFEEVYHTVNEGKSSRKKMWLGYAIGFAVLIMFILFLVYTDDPHYTPPSNVGSLY